MKPAPRPLLSSLLSLILLAATLLNLLIARPAIATSVASLRPDLFLPMVQLQKRIYGVLQPDQHHLASDWQAGIRARTLELGWDYYEPQDGVFSAEYIATRKAEYQRMLDAGYMVVLDLGLQYPPEWARAIRPWRDQYGNSYDGQVNAIWSPTVRRKIEGYIARVFHDFGTAFLGVRLGSGGFVETLYPDSSPGSKFSYWAFDPDAMASNPVPHWRPGQPSPQGEAATFYTWYLQRLIDTVNWQQDVVRQSFHGYLIQLLPGQGLRPSQWDALIDANLTPYDKHIYAAERGAAWDRIVEGMRDRTNVIIACSSVGDSSATSPYVNELASDPIHWSSAHWVAYNADRYGLPKWAENPGRNSYEDMRIVFGQMDEFDYQGLFWAFAPDLYTDKFASIDQYASSIAQNP
jgi:hypothetical protein